ncbi:MAG: SRPBCC domain-containing protein [Sphingobacteriales bacterium]|nr:MAG: SRPBCC domain-containing protein [Sphingobacteriales bacterium]
MDKNLIAKASITINATPAQVWDAVTNPDKIKEYFFGTTTTSDWKEGSAINFKGQYEGTEYEDKGTIIKAEPNKVFQYSYWSSMGGSEDTPDNYAIITYTITPEADATRLEVLQEGANSEEAREHSVALWAGVLKSMKDMLER